MQRPALTPPSTCLLVQIVALAPAGRLGTTSPA